MSERPSREELGELILRLEHSAPPPTEAEARAERRREFLFKWNWVVVGWPAGILGVFLWLKVLPWVHGYLPATLRGFEEPRTFALFGIIAYVACVIGITIWLFTRGPEPPNQLASGVAELCERGAWIERPELEAAGGVRWEGLRGYRFRPAWSFVILVPTDAEDPYEDLPHPEFVFSVPTPTEEERAALLRELARRDLPDLSLEGEG